MKTSIDCDSSVSGSLLTGWEWNMAGPVLVPQINAQKRTSCQIVLLQTAVYIFQGFGYSMIACSVLLIFSGGSDTS